MCIPHSRASRSINIEKKEPKKRKKIAFDKAAIEKGDPNFVDERITPYKPQKGGGFFSKLFS